MTHTRKIVLLLFVAGAAVAFAVSPYPQLELKANRFFNQREWAQAAATYDLMLDEKPGIPATYGKAIVAGTMAGDSTAALRLFHASTDNHIPFDSIFSHVRATSFELGRTDLYEHFLLSIKEQYPWMRRTINSYLLRYYAFRRDGANMVAYADIMLQGAPDNIDFMTTKAEGLMLMGDARGAIDIYRSIIGIAPDNYHTLLEIGNWYAMQAEKSNPVDSADAKEASDYLLRAYGIKPTPHVAATLTRLGYPPAGTGGKKHR